MSFDPRKRIEQLRQEILKHDYNYYVLSQPKVSDKEYDDLLKRLKELEDKHPQFKSNASPTVRISQGLAEGFAPVKHKEKMFSLDNTYSVDELKEWDERTRKNLSGTLRNIEYVAELKIDGVSANITYKNGYLSLGATRGDGQTGEDVTQNIRTIRAIPLQLNTRRPPELIEVRGEVYMDRSDFDKVNKERKEKGEAVFANPRNATSGSLKLLDSAIVAARHLNFFSHSLGACRGIKFLSQWEVLNNFREWGLRVNGSSRLCKNIDEVIDYCEFWKGERDKLTYDIDGVVLKVNILAEQKELGFTLKSPRWAVAYKFPARQATTKIENIIVNVGRTGVITPTAELDPVECGGVIIRHATLHNFDEIKRLNVKIGDRVLIERAGDVIPKVVKVVESKGKIHFSVPKFCPVCSGRILKEKEEDVAYRCINPNCPAQLERSLLHFSSRQAMDIEGLGEAVINQLVAMKLVKKISDIYKLGYQDLAKLELFKEKKINNLLLSIEKSKNRPFSRLIYALGIRHVGEKAAYVLGRNFRTMDSLMAARFEDLDKIYEVGPVMAKSIVEYLSLPENKAIIEALRQEGVNLEEKLDLIKKSSFSGKTIVFTGELKDYTRSRAEELARRSGANVSSSVSKNTDFLVAGGSPGSKYDKAKKLGIKIINEDKFKEMIG